MHHIAIMKKEWKLTAKILSGEKRVETRWYKQRRAPWNRIKSGDVIWFMEGGYVRARAIAGKVEHFEVKDEQQRRAIMDRLGKHGVGPVPDEIWKQIEEYAKGKKYCIAVWLEKPEKVGPFRISKKGHGAMSAWIVVEDIEKLKI